MIYSKTIEVAEKNGVYRLNADFEKGFLLIPHPKGVLTLSFWDEKRMMNFLRLYGFTPLISHILPTAAGEGIKSS